MIMPRGRLEQATMDYAVDRYGIPAERIMQANGLYPGLVEGNSGRKIVNLDRLGATIILSLDDMCGEGFRVSPRFSSNVNSWYQNHDVDRALVDEDRFMAAELCRYWQACLEMVGKRLGPHSIVTGKKLLRDSLDYSDDGNPDGLYPSWTIRKEIRSNLYFLEQVIRAYEEDFCSLPQRPENAERIVRGISEALSNNPFFYNTLLGFVGWMPNQIDREDVISEFFLREIGGSAMKYRYMVSNPSDLATDARYLGYAKISLRSIKKDIRKQRRIPVFSQVGEEDSYIVDFISSLDRTPIQILIDEETKLTVTRNLLQNMDTDKAGIITMGIFQGMPYREMATKLGIPIGSVKSRLREAKKKFRSLPEIRRLGLDL